MMFLLGLKKVWEWLKRNWKYILFPVGILLALFAYRRRPDVIAPRLLEAEEARKKAAEEAEKKIQKAREERDKRIEEIEKEHSSTVSKLTDEQRSRLEELREDPDELNSFLLGVGKEIRS